MSEFWFKPRRYGYGATPTSWEGWATVAAYLVAVGGLGYWFNGSPDTRVVEFILSIALLTAVLIFISWKRTKGEWLWRWGDPD